MQDFRQLVAIAQDSPHLYKKTRMMIANLISAANASSEHVDSVESSVGVLAHHVSGAERSRTMMLTAPAYLDQGSHQSNNVLPVFVRFADHIMRFLLNLIEPDRGVAHIHPRMRTPL